MFDYEGIDGYHCEYCGEELTDDDITWVKDYDVEVFYRAEGYTCPNDDCEHNGEYIEF